MTVSIRSKKSKLMDEKIDLFCQRSAELLENIHARCGNMDIAKPKKKKKTKQIMVRLY